MKVKLKFYGLGINDKYQAKVLIYDLYDNLIYEGYTYNGYLTICLDANKSYKLIATSCGDVIRTNFYVKDYEYLFFFRRSLFTPIRNVTLLLTDYYYDNLPISKGELILWQK